MKNIIADINNKAYKKLYLITGEEIFLEEYYLNRLVNSVTDGASDDFNTMVVSREATDEMTVNSFVDSYPLMCDKKILVIKNTGILKKATEDEKKFWPKVFEDIPDYAVIVFYENEVDKRSVIYKAICKNGYVAEFPLQKGASLTAWVAKILKANGKLMSANDIEYLIESCNPGMINIKCELEKLICHKKENAVITKQDIDILVNKSVESQVFEMAEDIAKGNVAGAQKKLDDMKKLGLKPPEILPAVFSKFASYRKIKLLESLPVSQIAAKTKSRDFFIKRDLQIVKKLSINQLDNVVYLCQSADQKVKSGQSDGWLELSMIVVSCSHSNNS